MASVVSEISEEREREKLIKESNEEAHVLLIYNSIIVHSIFFKHL